MDLPISGVAHSRASALRKPSQALPCSEGENASFSEPKAPLFDNPFYVEDLLAFDDDTLQRILRCNGFGLSIEMLARSLHGAPDVLVDRIERNLPASQCSHFMRELHRSVPQFEV